MLAARSLGARWIAPVMIAIATLAPLGGASTAAAQDAALAISIDSPGPYAPGETVTVSIAGGNPHGDAIIAQCAVSPLACLYSGSLLLDGDGAGTAEVRIKRYRMGEDFVADCAAVACDLRVYLQADGEGPTASTPITIDPSAPLVRPVVSVEPDDALAGRDTVLVTGEGFESDRTVLVTECQWTATVTCLPEAVAWADIDQSGSFSASVPVTRIVDGTDCAGARGRCQLWIAPYGDLDQLTIVPLGFDPDAPLPHPELSVVPATQLQHQQTVTITGSSWSPSADVEIQQCVAGAASGQCRYLTYTTTDDDGGFSTEATLSRRVGLVDCASSACVVRARAYPFDDVSTPVSFDGSVPPPPVPSVVVEPTTDLVDFQIVDVRLTGVEPGSYISLSLCATTANTCRGNVFVAAAEAQMTVPFALPRLVSDSLDCAVIACEVRIQIFGADSIDFAEPVSFDPDAPLAAATALRVLPATGLWDRQRVEVRGERLEPGSYIPVRQCIDVTATPGTCGSTVDAEVDSRGALSTTFTVRRTLELPSGSHDCVVTTCYLVAGYADGPASSSLGVAALGFDPAGPVRGSDLPAQLPCVPWPTATWPVGELPTGVDKARVAEVGEQMVGPGAGSSVVVIHGGRLVYENYADGVTPDTILQSFSMSKSFTSTVVGLLVDDGALALDDRAPVPAWSAPGDPRGQITLRNLLNMASGLQFREDYGDATSDVVQMVLADDNAAYAAAKPLAAVPGTRFSYSTGDTMLLAKIIGDTAGVSGESYRAYLHDRLLDPLGIEPASPGFDASGTWRGGYQTDTTTRNFAKLGLLYLRDGVWEDEQFLSSEWVDFVRTPGPYAGYGGQFWLDGDGSFRMVGLYGQAVEIVPELDLIVSSSNGAGTEQMVELFRSAASPSCTDDAREAVADEASTIAMQPVDIDVLANDIGGAVGLASATLTVADLPANGDAQVVDGRVRYQPDASFTGRDAFSYVVCTNDRARCIEGQVSVQVDALEFAFTSPAGEGVHRRAAGHAVFVGFRLPAGPDAISAIESVAVDCGTGVALGAPAPVDAEVRAGGLGSKRFWFRWRTDPGWTGCRDLAITTADGQLHVRHFTWRSFTWRSFTWREGVPRRR